MGLTFQCPHCACAYALDDACAGTALTCRQCGSQIQAPGTPPVPSGKLALSLPLHFSRQENDMTTLASSPTRFLNQVTRHIERTIGPSPMVFHEIISTDIHLDLHIIPPGTNTSPDHPHGRNFYTLVTSGMSARPMTPPPSPADPDSPRHAELMISLPADWPGLRRDGTFVQEYMLDEANWWPLRFLKLLARMPHEQGSSIAAGQIIPNGPRAEPFAPNTRLGAMLLLPSRLHPKAAQLVAHDDITIHFLALWPLHPCELAYQHRHGTPALQSALAQHHLTDLVSPCRPSVVP